MVALLYRSAVPPSIILKLYAISLMSIRVVSGTTLGDAKSCTIPDLVGVVLNHHE